MKNKLIIFDCFGVIFDEVAPVFLRNYLPDEEAAMLKEKLFVPADLGEVTYNELLDNMASALNLDKVSMTEQWEALFHLREEMVPIIKKLKEKADVALLSNAPLGVIEKQFEKHNLTPLFDKIFVSCNLKLAKPDPEIYRHCVNAFGKEYDEIYMIDDNLGNLEILPEIGINPIHFTGIDCLSVLKG